jgi:hypothetical protein
MAHPEQHTASNELLEVMDFSFLCMNEGDLFDSFIHLLFLSIVPLTDTHGAHGKSLAGTVEGAQYFHFCDCFSIFFLCMLYDYPQLFYAYTQIYVICQYYFYASP